MQIGHVTGNLHPCIPHSHAMSVSGCSSAEMPQTVTSAPSTGMECRYVGSCGVVMLVHVSHRRVVPCPAHHTVPDFLCLHDMLAMTMAYPTPEGLDHGQFLHDRDNRVMYGSRSYLNTYRIVQSEIWVVLVWTMTGFIPILQAVVLCGLQA